MQQDLESLSEAVLGIYAADPYMNLPFLMRARRPRNCYFRLDTQAPGGGAVCVWKHPMPEMPLFAIFSSGTLETQIGLFRSLKPGRYLVVMPDGGLPSVLAEELALSSVKRNCVYSRESKSHLDPGPARRLGPEDVTVLEAVHPRLAKVLRSGSPVFGVTMCDTLVTSCSVSETLDSHCEIANVHTQEDSRRQGYGRFVVSSAVNYILDNGRTPIYECDRENVPSIRTAESTGFLLKATHFEAEAIKE